MTAFALAVLLLVGIGADHPIFTSANVDQTGSWTGYRATIQVRPLTYAIWPGGYLSDGTFVQNGFLNNYGEGLYAFAWAISTAGAEAVPLTFTKVTPTPLSWVTFELAWASGRWTFRYRDAAGWHRQGSWRSNARLEAFQVVNEYWAPEPHPFATQAVRNVQVRDKGGWFSPSMSYGPPPETCGHDIITSRVRGSLVFRSVEAQCEPYSVLWRA
jgi:hypothetical protein